MRNSKTLQDPGLLKKNVIASTFSIVISILVDMCKNIEIFSNTYNFCALIVKQFKYEAW